jgi:starvation-inducible DNA-binding protein
MSTPTETRPGQADAMRTASTIKAYPAPSQLATPTDLNSQEAQAVIQAINPLIADAFALYVKTKNFHWHLAGSHFREYHRLFDQQAEQIFDAIDPLAERVRKLGGTTIRSISHISQLQSIADDNEGYVPPGEMARRLMQDNLHIAKKQRAAIEVCEKNRDSVTANLLQEILDKTERRKWFLFEVTQGINNTD